MTHKIQITTLTPIHIGSGTMLSINNDFTIDQKDIAIISPDKILELIGVNNIEKWSESIQKKESVSEYMKRFAPKSNIADYSKRVLKKRCEGNIREIKEYIHDGSNKPYIPGSSLKGAIRTALFAKWTDIHFEEHSINQIERGKNPCRQISKECFGNDPKVDILKYLRVGDCYFAFNTTAALQMGNLNLRSNHADALDMSKSQCIEVLDQNQKAECNISLTGSDHYSEYRPSLPIELKNINKLFTTINDHTWKLLEQEFDFWDELEEYENDTNVIEYMNHINELMDEVNNCSPDECIIRLGHGSGWTFMTGGWVEEKTTEQAYERVVDNSRPRNEQYYKQYPFPKTRRIEKSDTTPLGFIKLKLTDNN